MSQVVVIEPPEPLVSLELAKAHLRVDDDDSDALINLQVMAASQAIDGPGGWLGRALGEQTLELRRDGFCAQDWRLGEGYLWSGGWNGDAWARWPNRQIELPYPPLISVLSITYEDAAGFDQTLTSDGWLTSEEGLQPSFSHTWPFGRWQPDAVRIRYIAGYPVVPAPIQAAVLLLAGSLYANREQDVIDARAVVAENPAAERLLAPYRVWKL